MIWLNGIEVSDGSMTMPPPSAAAAPIGRRQGRRVGRRHGTERAVVGCPHFARKEVVSAVATDPPVGVTIIAGVLAGQRGDRWTDDPPSCRANRRPG